MEVIANRARKTFEATSRGVIWLLVTIRRAGRWVMQHPGQAVILLVILGFSGLLTLELNRSKTRVEPFEVPPTLAEMGYSGKLFARHFKDQLGELIREGRTKTAQAGVRVTGEETGIGLRLPLQSSDTSVDIEVPVLGVPLRAFARYLRELFGAPLPTVSGEVYHLSDREIIISARWGNNPAYKESTEITEIDDALRKIAERLFPQIDPLEYVKTACWQNPDECEKVIINLRKTGALSDYKSLAGAYVTWGNITSDEERAKALYRQATKLDQHSASARYNWGVALYRKGRYPEAIKHFKAALSVNCKYWPAYVGISAVERRRGNFPESIKWLQKIKPEKRWEEVYRNWGLTLEKLAKSNRDKDDKDKYYKEALEIFSDGISRFPHDTELRLSKGNLLRRRKSYDEAIAVFEKAEEFGLVNEKVYTSWAMALSKQKKSRAADDKFEKAVTMNPKFAFAYKAWGDHLKSRDCKMAAQNYLRAYHLNPSYRQRFKKLSQWLDAYNAGELAGCK